MSHLFPVIGSHNSNQPPLSLDWRQFGGAVGIHYGKAQIIDSDSRFVDLLGLRSGS